MGQMVWANVAPAASPPPRQSHAMAWDSGRARLVLFGGDSGGTAQFSDTWEWDGLTWAQVSSAGPIARSRHAMAFDDSRGRVVLFGGWDRAHSAGGTVTLLDDTWEWDGNTWTQINATGPQARAAHTLTWDPVRRRTVLFGGSQANSAYLADLWQWDGVSWQSVPTGAGPAGRAFHSATFVPSMSEILVYGGAPGFSDLWSWNGSRWLLRGYGPPLSHHAACWDPLRDRLVVRGGHVFPGGNNATGEWTGSRWIVQEASLPFVDHAMAFDTVGGQVIQFGGLVFGIGVSAVTVAFLPTVPAAVSINGPGCSMPAAAPQLAASRAPLRGEDRFALQVLGGGPLHPVLIPLATSVGSNQTYGTCTVVPDLAAAPSLFGATDAAGVATVALQIPVSTSVGGLVLYGQGIVLDGSGPLIGVASLTNGLRLVIGD